jgi:pyruvate,orthophosphate dikinase
MAKSFADASAFLVLKPDELTEATFAAEKTQAERTFLKTYGQWGFLTESPFRTIDRTSVGKLIHTGVKKAREAKSDVEIGVAGDLTGDPASIAFFYEVGVSSITCEYATVPIVRLCSAQAVIAAEAAAAEAAATPA